MSNKLKRQEPATLIKPPPISQRKNSLPQPSNPNPKQQPSIYCIIAAARRDTSAEDTKANADTLAAAPASGAGAGAEEGAMKSCADAEVRKTATARSSTATRGAITTLRCSLRVDRRIGEEGVSNLGAARWDGTMG